MKTTLHSYCYDTRKPEDAKEYAALAERLRSTPGRGRWHHVIEPSSKRWQVSGEVELETGYFFGNQWNSDKGRIFDWFEEAVYCDGRSLRWLKRGHWLEITDEMRALRDSTLVCGYTGQHFPASSGMVFNTTPSGLGSEYLTEKELHLLRLLPVSSNADREPLTEAERAVLLPLYVEAQTTAQSELDKERAQEKREEVAKEYAAKVKNAEDMRAGWTWLLDRGLPVKNVIFYDHSGRFSFGWQKPFSGAARAKWAELLRDFPAPFDLEPEDKKR